MCRQLLSCSKTAQIPVHTDKTVQDKTPAASSSLFVFPGECASNICLKSAQLVETQNLQRADTLSHKKLT